MKKIGKESVKAVTVGIFLGIAWQSPAVAASRSEIDLRQEWVRERTITLLNDVKQCNVLRENGLAFGRLEYNRLAPDCPTLYVNSRYMAAAMEEISIFFPLASQGYRQACYQSGWLMGYLQAHNDLFPGCEEQLTTIQQQNLQARIKQCKALGSVIKRDSVQLGSIIVQTAEDSARAEAEELARKMLLLVSIGRSGEAWDLKLQEQHNEIFDSLPCSVAIGMALLE